MSENFDNMRQMFKDFKKISNENPTQAENDEQIQFTENINAESAEKIECSENKTEKTIEDKFCTESEENLSESISLENNSITNDENITDEQQDNNVQNVEKSEDTNNFDVVLCPNCQNKLTKEDVFCNNCGTKLVQEPPKCPNCGLDYNKDEDIFCKKCGQKLKEDDKPISQNDFKICPYCGTKNILNAKYCYSCKRYIAEETKNLSDTTINEALYCPTCGSEIKKGEVFCGNCGVNLSALNAKTISSESSNSENKNLTITVNNSETSYDNNYHLRKCRYCGSNINKYSEKCPHCGEWQKVSHFGCGGFLVIVSTIIAVCLSIGGESIGIPLVGEIGGIWLVITAFLYFLPTLIAELRGHDSKIAIFIINLIFGWTFVGWIIAFIMSFTGRIR